MSTYVVMHNLVLISYVDKSLSYLLPSSLFFPGFFVFSYLILVFLFAIVLSPTGRLVALSLLVGVVHLGGGGRDRGRTPPPPPNLG